MHQRSYCLVLLTVLAICVASSCSVNSANEEPEINASVQRLIAAMNAKDMNGVMAYYSSDESLQVFDALPPRQYVGAPAYRKDWQGCLAAYAGGVQAEV